MAFEFHPLPHTDAVDRIAGLPLVSREVMDGLLPELRAYAFTITGLDVGDQMARARDAIMAVPAGEKTWDKAKREIAGELRESLGGKESERRAELLLRTHTFRGYAAARYRSLMAQIDVFPYWQYKTHGDGNVRPSHAALNGQIFPAGHPIWQRIFPPWDWGCRCLVVPLTARAVERIRNGPDALQYRIYSDAEATIIDKNQRLPGGVSLNASETWGSSPWSEAGNIRHTWDLVQKRYGDQPEVLRAFQDWAKGVEIPDLQMTVADWLSGGAARFNQPMKKSRYGMDIEFQPGEEEALRDMLSATGKQTMGELKAVPDPVAKELAAFETEVAEDTVENGAVWGPDGSLRVRKRSPRKAQVSLPEEALKDGTMSHNHPAQSPPSLQDVTSMIQTGAREVRVVTRDYVYRLQPGPNAMAKLESLPGFARRFNAGDIVARELQSGMQWSDDQVTDATQHSVLAWLAGQGIIHYERLPR